MSLAAGVVIRDGLGSIRRIDGPGMRHDVSVWEETSAKGILFERLGFSC